MARVKVDGDSHLRIILNPHPDGEIEIPDELLARFEKAETAYDQAHLEVKDIVATLMKTAEASAAKRRHAKLDAESDAILEGVPGLEA